MKNKLSLVLLSAMLSCAPLQARSRDDSRDCSGCFKATLCDIKHELKELNKSQPCTKIITAKDIGTAGYVINDPGYYCLGEDVNFAAAAPYTPAIQVLANNVTVDLEGHTLAQVNGGAVSDVYGVLIGQGLNYTNPNFVLNNVKVVNGAIQNFSGVGIFAYNGSFDSPSYAHTQFTNLTFNDLRILGCGNSNASQYFGSGINLDSGADDVLAGIQEPLAYFNVLINDCSVNQCFGNGSITVFTVDSLVIQNTQANDMFASVEFDAHPDVDGTFAYNIVGTNIQMFGCQGNRTVSYDPTGNGQVGGLSIENSSNIYVKDSQFNQAYGTTSSIVNNNLSLNINAVFENCQFNNNAAGPSAFIVVGVHASSGLAAIFEGKGVRWINCQFNGASVDPSNAFCFVQSGFLSTCLSNMEFQDCQACNISSNSFVFTAAGYLVSAFDADSPSSIFADASNLTFRRCIASDIQGPNQVLGFSFTGADVDITGTQIVSRNILFDSCIAQRIEGTTSNAYVAGITENLTDYSIIAPPSFVFMYPQLINLYVNNCRVSDISSNGSPYCAGIMVQSVQHPDIQNNSVSYCDRGILLTGTTTITPNGFELAVTSADATAIPPVFIPITTPIGSGTYSFTNLTHPGTPVIINGSDISNNFVLPTNSDLTELGWQPGDMIRYVKSSVIEPDIPGLVNGAIYYAIVYIPGFSTRGVIQDNEVDNCTVSGYQDDSSPYTTSAWINNTAVLNANNYGNINFPGTVPVDTGSISAGTYPAPGNKYYNVSLNA